MLWDLLKDMFNNMDGVILLVVNLCIVSSVN